MDARRGTEARADWIAHAVQQRLLSEDTAAPAVDLDAPPERPRVRFGGKLYELRDLNEFGAVQQRRLGRDGREFSKLWQSDEELDENQEARMEMLLEQIFDTVIVADDAVRAGFSESQRARTVLAFTYAPAKHQLAQLMALLQMNQAGDGASDSTS